MCNYISFKKNSMQSLVGIDQGRLRGRVKANFETGRHYLKHVRNDQGKIMKSKRSNTEHAEEQHTPPWTALFSY